jgi:hypothetical protein
MILSSPWCYHHGVQFIYLEDLTRLSFTKTNGYLFASIATSSSLEKILAYNKEFIGTIILAVRCNKFDFDVLLQCEFAFAPTRITPPSLEQQQSLKTTFTDHFKKGMTEPTTTEIGWSIVIVKKKDGTESVCVDYRAVNKLACKCVYSLLIIK